MCDKVKKIFGIMRHRALAGIGASLQRRQRRYRIPMRHKAKLALMSLPGQEVSCVACAGGVHGPVMEQAYCAAVSSCGHVYIHATTD